MEQQTKQAVEALVTNTVTTPYGTFVFRSYSSPHWYKRLAWNLSRGWFEWIKVKNFNRRQRKRAAAAGG